MATTICAICNSAIPDSDLRGDLKIGPENMSDWKQFDVCIECVHGLTSTCRRLVSTPFKLFTDDNGKVKDTQARTALKKTEGAT